MSPASYRAAPPRVGCPIVGLERNYAKTINDSALKQQLLSQLSNDLALYRKQ